MATNATNRVIPNTEGAAERILALEIRSWKIAYAVLEDEHLLDWGTSQFPPGQSASALEKIDFILRTYKPSVAVTRRTRRVNDVPSRKAVGVLRAVLQRLKRRSVRCLVIKRAAVSDYFFQRGCRNKDQIFAAVAERVSEMRRRMPAARKPWNPEGSMTAVFDALATAIAFDAPRQPILSS